MDIKPTKEKKKKKVSKKRATELNRRRESVLRNGDSDQSENLLAPSLLSFATHSAPGSRRGSVSESSDTEIIREGEEDAQSDDETTKRTDDLWKHTLPVAVIENTWKTKARRASTRRRSSGVAEADAIATLDKLKMEKIANAFKTKTAGNPKFFWDDDKPAGEVPIPEP